MMSNIYQYRFSVFFFSQLVILFGSLLIPNEGLEKIILSFFFIINLVTGIVLVRKTMSLFWLFILFFLYVVFNFLFDLKEKNHLLNNLKMFSYFIFYGLVTIQIIKQVWETKIVNSHVIFGLISGYISIGFIGFFICLAIEISNPGSFQGLNLTAENGYLLNDRLMYFSYITLLSIGYGDISPVTGLAQKAAILIGLLGQIYLVVITAIVVGKYINQLSQKNT